MRFIKILRYDCSNGFARNARKQILIFGMVIVFCISFCLRTREYIMFYENETWQELSISSSDVLLYCFGGMLRFVPESATAFHLPIIWLCLVTGICYLTLLYPYNDLSSTGIQVIIRCREKVSWWFSKCVWNTMTVISSFIVAHLAVLIFCVIAGIRISLSINVPFSQGIYGLTSFNAPAIRDVIFFLYILPVVVCSAVSILQMMLSLVMKPFLTFVCISIFWLSTAYFYSPYFIGNYAMPLRAYFFGNGSLQYTEGNALCLITYALSAVAGAFIMRRKELLSLEK